MTKKMSTLLTIGIIAEIITIILVLSTLFEIDFGRCLNSDGDGKLYNGEPYYNYINYSNTDAEKDDIVMTFCINNNYGECEYRYDVVILKNTNRENEPCCYCNVVG